MATRQEFSFNLGLAAAPETSDSTQYTELVRLYNACRILAYIIDLYTGAKSFPAEDWSVLVPTQSQRLQNTTRGYCKFQETVAAGQILHFVNNSGKLEARKANATDNTKPARGFAVSAANSGEFGEYMLLGNNSNFAGLTPGTLYYLGTAGGGITSTPPAASGNIVQSAGFALSATDLFFNPELSFIVVP